MEKENKNDLDKINSYLANRKNDLEVVIKDAAHKQRELILKEKEEEEKMNIENITSLTVRELEINGVCIRKLKLLEVTYESYGKFEIKFERIAQINSDYIQSKISQGDIVGLYKYQEKLESTPVVSGVVTKINNSIISVSLDSEVDEEDIPKNLAIVQLVNYVTYEKINQAIDRYESYAIPAHSLAMMHVLFKTRIPTFKSDSHEYSNIENVKKSDDLKFYNDNLNQSQKEAVNFALNSNELALIHGPPGTGKTTTIVEVILQAVSNGDKVLVVTPSNLAVDNIGEKLINFKNNNKDSKLELCRIGHPARVTDNVIDISVNTIVSESIEMKESKDLNRQILVKNKEIIRLEKKIKNKENYSENSQRLYELRGEIKSLYKANKTKYRSALDRIYTKCNVVLATIVGSGDNNLYKILNRGSKPYFDLLIIDECGQSIEAACWIPLLLAKKVILAGDHLQLPPTIKNKDIQEELSYTLFDRMIEYYNNTCCRLLAVQYRMNEKIMNFSNHELYDDKLSAHSSVENHKLTDIINKDLIVNDSMGLLESVLLSINTEDYDFFESRDEKSMSFYNFGEAEICKYLVNYLTTTFGLGCEEIGVISPYSAQIGLLKRSIESKDAEISTVDGFQGREKEIIIISLVRSNNKKDIGFLSDRRRLNVALTRAKRYLCVISDKRMLENKVKNSVGQNFLNNLADYFDKNGKEINVMETFFDHKEIDHIKENSAVNIDNSYKNTENKVKSEIDQIKSKKENNNNSNKNNKNKNRKNDKSKVEIKDNKVDNKNDKNGKIESSNNIVYESNQKDSTNVLVEKLTTVIQMFINSPLQEYNLKGLNSNERRLIHEIAEEKNLIHFSSGVGDNRELILQKKSIEIKDIKKEEIVQPQVPNKQDNLIINTTNKPAQKTQVNEIEKPKENKIIENEKKKNEKLDKPKQKGKSKIDDDDIDALLDSMIEQNKKCNFGICANTAEIKFCSECNFFYCIIHTPVERHGCEYTKNTPESNKLSEQEKKVQSKIKELEKKRNKQVDNKKKKK